MKYVIKAGTDAAMIAAFDAAALPGGFDDRIGDDTIEYMEELRSSGRLWFGGTGGDGTHVVHVLVDEPVDSAISARPSTHQTLLLPSGGLWVCGAEYMATDPERGNSFTPKGGLGRYRMGDRAQIAPGRYDLTVFVFDRGQEPSGGERMTALQLLQIAPALILGLGAIGVFFSSLALVISLILKLGQILTGSPLADKGWHALPVMIACVVVSALVVLAGRALGRRLDRMPAVARDRAAYEASQLSSPDVILALHRTDDMPVAG